MEHPRPSRQYPNSQEPSSRYPSFERVQPQLQTEISSSPKRKRDFEEEMDEMFAKDPESADSRYIIWGCRLKATPARLAVVRALSEESKPLSVQEIHGKIKKGGEQTTTYRTLQSLVEAGLVDKTHLDAHSGNGQALFELSFGRKHHHHAVCTSCGDIEDVTSCDGQELNVVARAGLKKFRCLESHSLEFFGVCRKCEAVTKN